MVLKAPDSYVYSGPRNSLLDNFMLMCPVPFMFYNTVKYCGHRPAQKFADGQAWVTLTYNESVERVENFGQGFIALGWKKGTDFHYVSYYPIWDWADYGGRAAGCGKYNLS